MVSPADGAGSAWALIGCGPRGLGVLERFVTRARHLDPEEPVTLHVVEPADLGGGLHSRDQPSYLLLNTIACQLTAFVDDAMIDGGGVAGPSLYDWAADGGRLMTENTGRRRPVEPTDHLPRALLGEYLAWAADRIRAAAPPWLRIVHHRSPVERIEPTADGHERVTLASGRQLTVCHVTLAVGHTGAAAVASPDPAAPADRWIGSAYPLPGAVAAVVPGGRVGVLGCGLTAMDVVAALTVGRGGAFGHETRADGTDTLRYHPSGEEPRLTLTSRHGLPARSRPLPARGGPTPAGRLTETAIAELRAGTGDGRLDFERTVLPLLRAELRYRIGLRVSDPAAVERVLRAALQGWDGPVPAAARADLADYRDWYRDRVAADLVEARRGLDGSAVKFAYEVVREHRDVLRAVVDDPGLTDPQAFFGAFAGAVNRNVICPQLERNDELLALIAAGVVTIGPGPAARLRWQDDGWRLSSTTLDTPAEVCLDRVVVAFEPGPSVLDSANPAVRGLVAAGRLRPADPATSSGGAALDRAGHPLDAADRPQPSLSVIGPLAEGSSYYNHYVPGPGARSRAVHDADTIVSAALDRSRHVVVSGPR